MNQEFVLGKLSELMCWDDTRSREHVFVDTAIAKFLKSL